MTEGGQKKARSSSGRKPSSNRNRNRRRSRKKKSSGKKTSGSGPKPKFKPQNLTPLGQQPLPPVKGPKPKAGSKDKKYAYVIYDTFDAAEKDLDKISEKAKSCDRLNIIIKAEGDRNHPNLTEIGAVFAGEAWHLIHTRRIEDGWYEELQE